MKLTFGFLSLLSSLNQLRDEMLRQIICTQRCVRPLTSNVLEVNLRNFLDLRHRYELSPYIITARDLSELHIHLSLNE